MQVIRIHRFGSADVLRGESIPMPEPSQGEARVKIEAAGINFIDVYQRTGQRGELPFTPGVEGAGVVDAVGAGVTEVKPGDRVAFASHPGSYAEYATVSGWKLVSIPNGVSTQQAAAAMLQGMTAHYLTHSTYSLQPGDTALIHAAAGGSGCCSSRSPSGAAPVSSAPLRRRKKRAWPALPARTR